MTGCSAFGCTNRNDGPSKVQVFKFPKNPKIRKLWIARCRRQDFEPNQGSVLCEVHFSLTDFYYTKTKDGQLGQRRIKKDALPSHFSHSFPTPKRALKPPRSSDVTFSSTCDHGYCSKEGGDRSEIAVPDPPSPGFDCHIEPEPASPPKNVASKRPHSQVEPVFPRNTNSMQIISPVPAKRLCASNISIAKPQTPEKPIPLARSLSEISSEDLIFPTPTKQNLFTQDIHSTETEIHKLQLKLAEAQEKIKILQGENQALIEELAAEKKFTASFKKLFREDQRDFLNRGTMKGKAWSPDSIQDGLRMWFACGSSAYKGLLQKGLPYPAVRTLQKHMELVDFTPGTLDDIFEQMKLKLATFNDQEKKCSIVFDEITLRPGYDYDIRTDTRMGEITPPFKPDKRNPGNKLAKHALVFILAGINTRWKQTIAFYFTGNSTDGNTMGSILDSLIQKSLDIGCDLRANISDMGPNNQALWRD